MKHLEIKLAVERLARNPILICKTFGGIFRICGHLGYFLIKPRYMEYQFRQSASSASFVTGSTSIVSMAIGIMAGGLMINRFKPKARPLVTLMFVVELFATTSILLVMFLNCPVPQFPNTQVVDGR